MKKTTKLDIEPIQSELDDQGSEPSNYDVVTYPADYTLEGLVAKYDKTIFVPGFQRKFVWTIKQSSRLIESFLLGLPVPPVFLYALPRSNELHVVDGQQRLLSIFYFFQGYFGEADLKGNRVVFRLEGLNEDSPYNGLTYVDLKKQHEGSFNRLNDAVLRAFIIKQIKPKGSSSIYHIFERLNTGGTQLVGQEIRNCIYHGPFNDMLIRLNKRKEWRVILGKPGEDKRQRDVELILRFLTLFHSSPKYHKPMKDFLSEFMEDHKNDQHPAINEFQELFDSTAKTVLSNLGAKPFHIRAGFNVAAFDGVFVAFARNLFRVPKNIKEKYRILVKSRKFLDVVSSSTTDEEVVKRRLSLVEKKLFK